jgi:hypothetical protein
MQLFSISIDTTVLKVLYPLTNLPSKSRTIPIEQELPGYRRIRIEGKVSAVGRVNVFDKGDGA